MVIMKKLDLFWRHSNCKITTKIQVADAVLRAKLLYGIESTQLIPSVLRRIEVFQLKVLRKLLKMDTAYINRANTNETVYKKATEAMRAETESITPPKQIVTFIETYRQQKSSGRAR